MLFRVSSNLRLTWENRPGAVRVTEYRGGADAPPTIVEHRINAQGFRGPEVAQPKPPGTYRVACLGDSHTFGTGVPEGATWPAHLERMLAAVGGADVEVMNCGVSAYDTQREVLLLRERVLDYAPDLVLLQYHVNDVSPRNALGWKPPHSGRLARWTDPGSTGVLRRLRAVSRAASIALDRLHGYLLVREESGLSLDGYAEASPGWRMVCAGLVSARDLLAEQEVDFAVVLYPYLLRRGEHLSSHEAFRRVSDFCRSEGIPCLDTESAFLPYDVEALRVHPRDPHANAAANRIFAGAVRDWLGTRLLASSGDGSGEGVLRTGGGAGDED
ncbi:MAG: SGNH/GDSL hydrolase family protein [Planctomycetota bacterium]